MKRLHLSLGVLLFLASCGDQGADEEWGMNSDARRPSDAARGCQALSTRHLASCNTVTQAGCEAGEKCALLVESDEPFLARDTCVPEGTALPGESCSRGRAGACTGFDDCIAGFHCMQNTCTRLCSQGPPDSCREDFEPFGTGSYCTVFEGVFYDGLGMCIDACNPDNDEASDGGATINTDCEPGEVCVASAEREAAVCLPPDANGL